MKRSLAYALRSSVALLASVSLARAADPVIKPVSEVALAAVDGLNGKISGFGGWNEPGSRNLGGIPGIGRNPGMFGGSGSVAFPLTHSFGVQLDASAMGARGTGAFGVGGHLFWRDPSVGLVGGYGSFMRANVASGFSAHRAAFEAEAYLGRFTIGGIAGYEGTQAQRVAGGATRTTQRFFDDVKLSYYPTDNWRVSIGHTYTFKRNAATLGTEYLVGSRGGTALALFAEAQIGTKDHRAVMAGATLYFGQKDKTLIRRHREDDPTLWSLGHLLFFLSNPGAYRDMFPGGPSGNLCLNPCGCF